MGNYKVSAPVVLIPRGGEWGETAAEQVREGGFTPLIAPLIETVPSPRSDEIQRAAADLVEGRFDWIVFASASAVPAFAGLAGQIPVSVRVAAVGAATEDQLLKAGFRVDLVPPAISSAKELIAHWPHDRGQTVLVTGSQLSPPALANGLKELGLDVSRVEAYQTLPVEAAQVVRDGVSSGGVAAIFVTSGSVATQVAKQLLRIPTGTHIICIGESSAASASRLGLRVAAIAEEQSIGGMLRALQRVRPASDAHTSSTSTTNYPQGPTTHNYAQFPDPHSPNDPKKLG